MKAEDIEIIKKVLKVFITKIRTYPLFNQIYTYYISDFSQQIEKSRIKIIWNFECIKLQIQRKILSQKNNYWDLKDSEVSIVENHINDKDFDKLFKEFVEDLFKINTDDVVKELEQEAKKQENADEDRLKKIVDNEKLIIPIKGIIKNNGEFPYKSDKIKGLLMLKLTTEQIFQILSGYEKWVSPRGYIEKYKIEREQQIKEGKIKEYPIEEEIKEIRRICHLVD